MRKGAGRQAHHHRRGRRDTDIGTERPGERVDGEGRVCSDDTAPVMTYSPPPRARRRGRGVEKRGFRGKERENPGKGKARKKFGTRSRWSGLSAASLTESFRN
jgi:hypothetical protein